MKKYIGKFYSFKFPKRKKAIEGLVLDLNLNWTLIATIHDYSFNGYTIFKNDNVDYKHEEYERFASGIFKGTSNNLA